jgi:hypothetical protein
VAGPSADELVANSQERGSPTCKDARRHHSASAARPRRRSDRIGLLFAASAHGGFWHIASNERCAQDVGNLEISGLAPTANPHEWPDAGLDRRLTSCIFCRPTLFRHRPHRSVGIWYACISRSAVGSPKSGRRLMRIVGRQHLAGAPVGRSQGDRHHLLDRRSARSDPP